MSFELYTCLGTRYSIEHRHFPPCGNILFISKIVESWRYLICRYILHLRWQNWPISPLLAAHEMYLGSICQHKHHSECSFVHDSASQPYSEPLRTVNPSIMIGYCVLAKNYGVYGTVWIPNIQTEACCSLQVCCEVGNVACSKLY